MAESLIPTIVPGQVAVKEKKTGVIKNHFPVDVIELMQGAPGKYEIVDNGAVEAARLSATPLKQLHVDPMLVGTEVVGIEGMVMIAMTSEQADEWRKAADNDGTKPTEADKAAEKAKAAEAKAPEPKPAASSKSS